jgi:MFS family permease
MFRTRRGTEQTGSTASRPAWLAPAAVLLGTGWGSNQFTPMLLIYSHRLGLATGTLEAMFGFYALGLIPGLLLTGPLSDAYGRRAVVIPAAALSLLATLVLIAGGRSVALLFAGRLLAGVSSGAAFAAGTAWLREMSLPPFGTADPDQAARRAVISMTAGFAAGPLVAGLLAQWVPGSTVVPYLPHLALMILVTLSLLAVPETASRGTHRRAALPLAQMRSASFRRVVAPMAPWVFATPAVAFALLPSVVGAGHATDGVALTAAIASLTAVAGVSIQPLARRLDRHPSEHRAGLTGLLVAAAGLALAALTAQLRELWLLVPCAITLGCAYGLCLVAGLLRVQRIADARSLAGLTAVFYTVTYLGFSAPYLIALARPAAGYPALLMIAATLALATAAVTARGSVRSGVQGYGDPERQQGARA